jgi:aconitate hydratase
MFEGPLPPGESAKVELKKGPNIVSLPEFEPLPDTLELPVLLKVGDDISTDEIMPAGARVLPFRSNIPEISRFCFEIVDGTYHDRAKKTCDSGGHAIVGGDNYGQGSSREHAALAPRHLGLCVVFAKTFARIHWQNLVNFGVLPLTFVAPSMYDLLDQGDRLCLKGLPGQLRTANRIHVECSAKGLAFEFGHNLSARQIEVLLAGGLIHWVRRRLADAVE